MAPVVMTASQSDPETARDTYAEWVRNHDTLTDADRAAIRRHVAAFPAQPHFAVVLLPGSACTPEALRATTCSVQGQLYQRWTLIAGACESPCVPFHPGALPPETDYVLFMEAGDTLAEHALYAFAAYVCACPSRDIIYSDEDHLDAGGARTDPCFKPDWNPDLLLGFNYLGASCILRPSLARAAGLPDGTPQSLWRWDLWLRATARAGGDRIGHIPMILYHRAAGHRERPDDPDRPKILRDHARRERLSARVAEGADGVLGRLRFELRQAPPRVTLIIPTRNHYRLLHRCADTIMAKTTYPDFDMLVVDNRSDDPVTLDYLAKLRELPRVRVIPYDKGFNFAAIINLGAREADGQVLAFVNDDIEVITPGWLDEMVAQAMRPEIGAVGAMLYYHDDTIQHAGVVLGLGRIRVADHAFRGLPRAAARHHQRACHAQNLSAVTAACMVMRKSVFDRVGGMNESDFAVAFNDVDLCLKVIAKGYRVVWTPWAELYHHESASRGREDTPEKRVRFEQEIASLRKRWSHLLPNDPAYNPNLSLDMPGFEPARPPRTACPWAQCR